MLPVSPSDTQGVNLRAHRAFLLLGAVAVPGFWVLDQINGLDYHDSIAIRLSLGVVAVAVVASTFVSRWARVHIHRLSTVMVYTCSAYFSWTAARNGLPSPWVVGVLLTVGMSGLALSVFASSTREVAVTLAGLLVVAIVPLFVTATADPDHSPLTFSLEIGVAIAGAYVAGVTRLRTLAVLAGSRRQLEAERDQSADRERLLQTVIDSIPDAIYVNDLDGRCVMRNQASAEALRLDADSDELGQTAFDLLPPAHAERDWQHHQHVIETGEASADWSEEIHWADTTVWYEHRKVPLRTSVGALTGIVGVARDVTHRVEGERELIEARDTAEAAARAKSEFLANMSHEIRTPMNGVVGMADVLAGSELTPDQSECVRTIQTCADALLALISDILDLSKIEAEGIEIESIRFSPGQTIRDAVDVVAPQASAKSLSLAVEVDESVPEVVLGDPARVRQVLLNLLSNAVKFTRQGGVTVRVRASDLAPSGLGPCRLQIEVQDTGIGIAPDKRSALFDAFTQADASTTREYGGTGLGLTISARLVTLMGGAITVDGAPGEGSTFAFDVRAEAVPDVRSAADKNPALLARARPAGDAPSHLRVLVAEDNAVNQRVVVRLLAHLGLNADVVDNGALALDALHQACSLGQPYDVVLMDVQMPVLDGHQATRRLRRELAPATQPAVIALTANAMAGDREACLDAGADDYLTKPIRREELQVALRTHGTRRAARAAAAEPREPTRSVAR